MGSVLKFDFCFKTSISFRYTPTKGLIQNVLNTHVLFEGDQDKYF